MTNSQLDESQDLGFGAVVASESGRRLLNRDGTFNVRRNGGETARSLSPKPTGILAILTLPAPGFALGIAEYMTHSEGS